MSCGGNDLSVKAGALLDATRRGRRGYSARRAGRAEGYSARRAIPPLSRSFRGNQGRVENRDKGVPSCGKGAGLA